MAEAPSMSVPDLLALTAQIVSAHVAGHQVAAEALPDLITRVHGALASAGTAPTSEPEPQRPQPAVSVRKSIQPDYLVCLEDGAKVKMLKRYLKRRFGLEPDEYRAKWGLPSDYPMVAPNYAERRSTLAKELGLGRKRQPSGVVPVEVEASEEPTDSVEQPLFAADLRDETDARHTADSVFANFGSGRDEAANADQEEAAPEPGATKRGRKPFAQQSLHPARTRRAPADS